ncbi:MAG: fungal specific transcription factor domain-containing protein, partial [Sphingobacteriales bacterium]
MKHRLFWSIFILDRMLAVSIGQPVGLVDEDMDVPQPAMTVEEFASSERTEHASLLQLNRHIIQLRQLEHQILASIHTRGHMEISNMSSLDRRAVSRQLRSAVDEWYSVGCLVCLPEADNIPIHSTITWLNARYYNLLILLYYPCHFNDQSKPNSTLELLGSIRKHFKYNYILLENKQLPLNYITLNRLMPACLALMHCFCVLQPCNFHAKSELGNCIDILCAFPEEWLSAHRAKEVAREFLNVVATHEAHAAAQLISYTELDTRPLTTSTKTDLKRVVAD